MYIDKILNKFGMTECCPKPIPCDQSICKSYDHESKPLDDNRIYREIVGSLIYLMSSTRPDICYTVCKLSTKLNCPTHADLNLAKHVLKYLKGT